MTTVEPARQSTREAVVDLHTEGLDANQIAQALGVTRRTVDRYMVEVGLREPRPPRRLSPSEEKRVRALLSEGMPATWVAEDVRQNPTTIAKRFRSDPDNVRAWRQVWQQIRRSEVLYDLHNEFYPRRSRAV